MAGDMNRQRREEQEAVRTTIVGGRPPGCGKSVGHIPRGIEVLVKKAAVDPAFKSLLLSRRGEAARNIGLELSPAESMMLSAVPAAQLQSIIAATTVPPSHTPAFLGKVAAVMLAALGIVQCGCDDSSTRKPAAAGPEGGPKDNVAATSRPAKPTDDQPLTIAGAVIVKPLTRPATQPVGVAGLTAVHPEEVTVLGLRADAPTRPTTSPTSEPVNTQPANDRSPRDVTVFGLMIDRPQNTVIRGLRVDTPRATQATRPTQPTSQPAAESSPPPPLTVLGLIADRPAAIRGIRIDRPAPPTTAPATQPTTKPAIEPAQPPEPDFPIAIDGIRPDRPRRSE